MDFLSRLVGGVGIASTRKLASDNPQQRLTRFKKTYNQILRSWDKCRYLAKSGRGFAEETIEVQLRRLTTLLHDDTRASVPHLCLAFASSPQVYLRIGSIAVEAHHEQIALEAVAFFSTLVDNDEESVLGDSTFSQALMGVIDNLIPLSSTERQIEVLGEVLELLFGVAAQIRLEPDILPAWFYSHNSASPEQKDTGSTAIDADPPWNSREDFPLCHRFVSYVYNEGRVGDFARTGLLYIFESASSSPELETWIVNSDLPTLMASGLGALYSQLNRKLTFAHAVTEMPLILALSKVPDKESSGAAESFHSSDLQSRLSTFLSYLLFWQDILDYCRSMGIKSTLVGHFKVFFLEQILYPSLLESSDIDGGSSVAVQTYLWRILDAVKHPDLIRLILNYLLGAPDMEGHIHHVVQPNAANTAEHNSKAAVPQHTSSSGLDPSYFNLTDLILANVSSANAETQCAALRTISVLIRKHHLYTSNILFTTIHSKFAAEAKQLGSLQLDICNLLDLGQSLSFTERLDDAYEACLEDAMSSIESHICYEGYDVGERRREPAMEREDGSPKQRQSQLHVNVLNPGDPLLRALCNLLEMFLQNEIEVNLGLTNVFTHLLSCPLLRLEGILTTKFTGQNHVSGVEFQDPDRDKYLNNVGYDEEEGREILRLESYKASRLRLNEDPETPILLAILTRLVRQIKVIMEAVPDLTDFLASRKRALLGSIEVEHISLHALVPEVARRSIDTSQQRPPTPHRQGQSRSDGLLTTLRYQSRASSPATNRHGERSRKLDSQSHSRRGSGDSSTSALKRQRQMSPLKSSFNPPVSGSDSQERSSSPAEDILKAQVRFSGNNEPHVSLKDTPFQDEAASNLLDGNRAKASGNNESDTISRQRRSTSLHHVLTNIVLLQEFILELASLVHTRASLFGSDIEFT